MLYRETVAVNCKNQTKYISAMCGHNAEFFVLNFTTTCILPFEVVISVFIAIESTVGIQI